MSATPARQYAWMPCREHGGVGDAAGCQTCQQGRAPEPPPPGETGTELQAGDALAAFHESLLALTLPAGLRLEVDDLHIRRFNCRAVVHVHFTDGTTATLRIAEQRVAELRDKLNAFLEAKR